MASKSKTKGKTFERELCSILNKITSLNWNRVPNSGAYTGGLNSFRNSILSKEQIDLFEGDIIAPKEFNHIRFECKFYKDIGWSKLFNKDGESKLNSWIEQSEQGTKPYWLLLFKINNNGIYIVYDNTKLQFNNNHNVLIYKNKYNIIPITDFFENNIQYLQKLGTTNEQSK